MVFTSNFCEEIWISDYGVSVSGTGSVSVLWIVYGEKWTFCTVQCDDSPT